MSSALQHHMVLQRIPTPVRLSSGCFGSPMHVLCCIPAKLMRLHPTSIPMDILLPPQTRSGPMTRARARAIETEVNSFLFKHSLDSHENWLLPQTKHYAFLGTKEKAVKRRQGGRRRCHRVWVWVELPYTLTSHPKPYPSPLPISVDMYNFFPYPSPIRVNGYPRVKLSRFAAHQFEHYTVINNNL